MLGPCQANCNLLLPAQWRTGQTTICTSSLRESRGGSGAQLVDPLSLVLGLQSDADDRVRQALAELEEHLP